TGELGAGAGAARRAVVGLAGAEDEIPAVGGRVPRRAVQLNVVDLLPAGPGDLFADERFADAASEVRQLGDAGHFQLLAVVADQEEPVAAPGHVAGHGAEAFDPHPDVGVPAVARHVLDGDVVAAGVLEGDDADRR